MLIAGPLPILRQSQLLSKFQSVSRSPTQLPSHGGCHGAQQMVFMCSGLVLSLFECGAHEIDLRLWSCSLSHDHTRASAWSLACLASSAHDLAGLYDYHCGSCWDWNQLKWGWNAIFLPSFNPSSCMADFPSANSKHSPGWDAQPSNCIFLVWYLLLSLSHCTNAVLAWWFIYLLFDNILFYKMAL